MQAAGMGLARWLIMGRKNYSMPLINVVRLSGVLATQAGGRAPAGAAARTINEQRCEPWLARAFSPSLRPAAVAVAINSPGGSPVQADLLYRSIRCHSQKTGVPVYTFAEDVAASGGYWLLCAGDKTYALEGSLVGSIGVISATFGAHELLKKLGIERRVFTAGEAKVALDPFLPVQPDQQARLQDIAADLHETFKQRVRDSRGTKLATGNDAELFSGRAWTGKQAKKLGLIDELGDLRTVMQKEFGDRARFNLCSPLPSMGPFGFMFGSLVSVLSDGGSSSGDAGRSLWPAATGSGAGGGGSGVEAGLKALLSSEAGYAAMRQGVEAVLDAAEERALWDKFRVH